MFMSKLNNTRKLSRPLSPFHPFPPLAQLASSAAKQPSSRLWFRPQGSCCLLLPACCALCSKKVQYTRSLCDISEQTVGGGKSGGMCIVHTLHIIVKAAVAAGIAARNHLNWLWAAVAVAVAMAGQQRSLPSNTTLLNEPSNLICVLGQYDWGIFTQAICHIPSSRG